VGLRSRPPATPACSGPCAWHEVQSCPSSTSRSGAGTCVCVPAPSAAPDPHSAQLPPVLPPGLARPWASRQSPAPHLALLLRHGGGSSPWQPWWLCHLQTSLPRGGGWTSFQQSCGGHVGLLVEGLGLLPPCPPCPAVGRSQAGLILLPGAGFAGGRAARTSGNRDMAKGRPSASLPHSRTPLVPTGRAGGAAPGAPGPGFPQHLHPG